MKSKATIKLIAHAKELENNDSNDQWAEPQLLVDHLRNTAKNAGQWAQEIGGGDIGFALGLIHDAGKCSDAFQKKIRLNSGYEKELYKDQNIPYAPHSDAGAQYAYSKYGDLGKILAYAIAGHHGGMPNGNDEFDTNLTKRLKRQVDDFRETYESLNLPLPESINDSDYACGTCDSKTFHFALGFKIRMLFSCLVDADFLDAEDYMEPYKSLARRIIPDFEALLAKLNRYVTNIGNGKPPGPIDGVRQLILQQCRKAAEQQPGFFSLTAPTGGGKTLSSMAFALTHAIQYRKKRIIYIIPFTSIIEQNAHEFRKALGDDVVLEHHSAMDPQTNNAADGDGKEKALRVRLAAENWDMPVVVSTNVQFFESMFANRPSKCRKLHNIANSVIVLDEAQMLPPDFLLPTLKAMNELVNNYGCSIVLCTATQPALNWRDDFIAGLTGVREIIDDPAALYESLRRVKITNIEQPLRTEELAEKINELKQVLCIVNTRRNAREIFQAVEDRDGLFHLSTSMCPAHRSEILAEIRRRLAGHEPCRVVSTQLVEAGVHLDFPVVYRAEAGIDSIAQAAGRCNREGKMELGGQVFVFRLDSKRPPPGLLRQSADEANKVICNHRDDMLSLDAVNAYFRGLYWKRSNTNGLDKKGILGRRFEDGLNYRFKDIAQDYKLITEDTRTLVVPWNEGAALCQTLLTTPFPNRYLLRKLQRYTVAVWTNTMANLLRGGYVEDVFTDGSVYVLTQENLYDAQTGLDMTLRDLCEGEGIFI